jgi:hypothetical protein|tara:strand:- start:150 stop:908 length:759 start_codon:yes stop_codon:yes gene_type:complete
MYYRLLFIVFLYFQSCPAQLSVSYLDDYLSPVDSVNGKYVSYLDSSYSDSIFEVKNYYLKNRKLAYHYFSCEERIIGEYLRFDFQGQLIVKGHFNSLGEKDGLFETFLMGKPLSKTLYVGGVELEKEFTEFAGLKNSEGNKTDYKKFPFYLPCYQANDLKETFDCTKNLTSYKFKKELDLDSIPVSEYGKEYQVEILVSLDGGVKLVKVLKGDNSYVISKLEYIAFNQLKKFHYSEEVKVPVKFIIPIVFGK